MQTEFLFLVHNDVPIYKHFSSNLRFLDCRTHIFQITITFLIPMHRAHVKPANFCYSIRDFIHSFNLSSIVSNISMKFLKLYNYKASKK